MNKIIKIDSNHAESYFNNIKSSSLFDCDSVVVENNESIQYSVQSLTIPYSFYGCNDYNCYMDVRENNIQRSIQMPKGNYNSFQYFETLALLLNTNQFNNIYTITYSEITNKISIQCNANVWLLFATGNHQDNNNHRFLGFNGDDLLLQNGNLNYSNNVCVMTDIQYLQISSDLGSSNIISGSNEDCLLEIIPINACPNGVIQFTAPINKYLLTSKSFNQVRIKLVDNLNRDVNLNGLSFLLLLRLDIINNDLHNIKYSNGRDTIPEGEPVNKTNLDYIKEQPGLISMNNPVEENSLLEFSIFTKMMKELKKIKNQKKKYTK